MNMITDAIIKEFDLEFLDEDHARGEFDELIANASKMIGNSRDLISDDELMTPIIYSISRSIAYTILIMLGDDHDDVITVDRVTDQIAVIIMDSMID